MLAAILAALVPVVVALVTGLLGTLKMPADATGAVETALDRVLRWIVELITGAEATAGASDAKGAATAASDAAALGTISGYVNPAEETLAVDTFHRIINSEAEAHRHGLTPAELRELRAVPENRVRSRVRELVAQSNAQRDAVAGRAGAPPAVLRSPAAGRARLAALAAGRLHADAEALDELLSHWPRVGANGPNEPAAGGNS